MNPESILAEVRTGQPEPALTFTGAQDAGIVPATGDSPVDNHLMVSSGQIARWDSKVDPVAGKGLSSNDYTDNHKSLVETLDRSATSIVATDLQFEQALAGSFTNILLEPGLRYTISLEKFHTSACIAPLNKSGRETELYLAGSNHTSYNSVFRNLRVWIGGSQDTYLSGLHFENCLIFITEVNVQITGCTLKNCQISFSSKIRPGLVPGEDDPHSIFCGDNTFTDCEYDGKNNPHDEKTYTTIVDSFNLIGCVIRNADIYRAVWVENCFLYNSNCREAETARQNTFDRESFASNCGGLEDNVFHMYFDNPDNSHYGVYNCYGVRGNIIYSNSNTWKFTNCYGRNNVAVTPQNSGTNYQLKLTRFSQ